MKYKAVEGETEKLISKKLDEIEQKENVRILHAVESGSRAWGFASSDSDYDVRFIYVRPKNDYLKLENRKDTIDWELNEILDVNGWDIRKVLQHFYKSNATVFEWANSPIIYRTTDEWEDIYEVGKEYFYALRPILAAKWIEKRKCPPPVLFQELVDEILEEDMKEPVARLVESKIKMAESDKAKRLVEISNYLLEQIAYYKELLESGQIEDRQSGWNKLDEAFLRLFG